MRTISNFTTGFPNQLGHISDGAGTIAEVLRAEGYVPSAPASGTWRRPAIHPPPARSTNGRWAVVSMFAVSSVGASIGEDYGLAVSERYEAPFAFSGTLHEVDIELGRSSNALLAAQARAEMARQ